MSQTKGNISVHVDSKAKATQQSRMPLHFNAATIQGLLDFADLRNIRRIEVIDNGTHSVLHTIARVRSAIKAMPRMLPQKLLASTTIVIKTDRLSWHELSILRKRYLELIDVDTGRWRIATDEGVRLIVEQTQLRETSRRLKSSKPVSLKLLTKQITLLSRVDKPDFRALNRLYLHRAALAVDLFFNKANKTDDVLKSWEYTVAMAFIEPYLAVAEANLQGCNLGSGTHRTATLNAVLLQVVQPPPSTSPWRIRVLQGSM